MAKTQKVVIKLSAKETNPDGLLDELFETYKEKISETKKKKKPFSFTFYKAIIILREKSAKDNATKQLSKQTTIIYEYHSKIT